MKNSPNQLANLDKGIATRFKPGDKKGKVDAGRKGGVQSGKSKTISAYLKAWSKGTVPENLKERLEKIGIDAPCNNSAIIAGRLVELCSKGDLKAIQFFMEKIGEDDKRQAEIDRLKAEIELLKLQKKQIELGEKATVEDLTPLAELLRMEDGTSTTND